MLGGGVRVDVGEYRDGLGKSSGMSAAPQELPAFQCGFHTNVSIYAANFYSIALFMSP